MKRFTLLSLVILLFCTVVKANVDNWAPFYSYLSQKVVYPAAARMENHQGNSIVTFDVVAGTLKQVNVQTELGKGCDIAFLNSLMTYPQLKTIKEGKYAIMISFRLQGSNAAVINETAELPTGFTALNTLHIIGYPSATAHNNMSPKEQSGIKIRGYGGAKSPIYVLDGVLVSSADILDLDQNNIQSVSILKDASAVALYGPQAQDGVISVTTKKLTKPEISGTTGKENQIMLRGANTVGKVGLYIVDGEIATNGLTGVDPNNIQTVEVLKNASAVALYGPQASDGVIIITTKKSAPQKTKK